MIVKQSEENSSLVHGAAMRDVLEDVKICRGTHQLQASRRNSLKRLTDLIWPCLRRLQALL